MLGKNTSLKQLRLCINLNEHKLENILLLLKENDKLEKLELSIEMRELIPKSHKLDPRISFDENLSCLTHYQSSCHYREEL